MEKSFDTPPQPSLRERHAAQTREAVLEAAYRLFIENGYTQTTIGQIAKEAGVSVQTIYTSVGNKGELIAALVEQMDVTAGSRDAWAKIDAAKNAREQLRIGLRVVRTFPERYGDLLDLLADASGTAPELRGHIEAGQARHRGALSQLIKRINKDHGLKKGMTEQRAGAIMAAMTNRSVWQDLHEAHGWTYDEIEDWLTDALASLLLK